MNTSDDASRTDMPDWHDPFGEPRTIPGGWDFAGLTGETPGAHPAPPPQPRKARRPVSPAWLAELLTYWN